MQYVRSISGSVSKTWNSINPATLSGAIDVIVVEHEDGTLACSPFHVRFGKFSLLRPSEKKVEFKVNNVPQNYAMKLGDGGEAFFVFETTSQVPEALQTSPLVSPASSPVARPITPSSDASIRDPDFLDLDLDDAGTKRVGNTSLKEGPEPIKLRERAHSTYGHMTLPTNNSEQNGSFFAIRSSSDTASDVNHNLTSSDLNSANNTLSGFRRPALSQHNSLPNTRDRSGSPPPLSQQEALTRAITLSKKLWSSNIPSQVNDQGDLMLDMTGYKSSEEESLRAEVVARQILSEELEGEYDIGSLIGADEKGNLWIYSSEEAKEAALSKVGYGLVSNVLTSTDALSDPGYQSDDTQSQKSDEPSTSRNRRQSDGGTGLATPPESPNTGGPEPGRSYAKTLRLTSDQLKSLDLKPGGNPMSFSVNRATCQAYMYLWKWDIPIVISDIDGTITKSDALGHVLNMIGRDWTHLGVAKLYTDIVANGYNIFYLTSRSVGQADTTRAYINGIVQDGYKLPKGPVIMSPDRTIAALRREIYLRKPEVFKMACLRDIMSLFNTRKSPFYAGFGNRLTDALSYRSVNIPSTRIFTINSNAEVSLDLLSLNKYKTGYTSMRETVDHFFPPVGMLVQEGGEDFTDFNYWRDVPPDMDDFSGSGSEDERPRPRINRRRSLRSLSEDEGSAGGDDDDDDGDDDDDAVSDEMENSYLSHQESMDDSVGYIVRQSIEVEEDTSQLQARTRNSDIMNTEEETLDALDLVSDAMPS